MQYFSQFGPLDVCYVPPSNDPSSGLLHKGIAFISFKHAGTAQNVLLRSQYEVKPGKFVVVDKAKTRKGVGADAANGSQGASFSAKKKALKGNNSSGAATAGNYSGRVSPY